MFIPCFLISINPMGMTKSTQVCLKARNMVVSLCLSLGTGTSHQPRAVQFRRRILLAQETDSQRDRSPIQRAGLAPGDGQALER